MGYQGSRKARLQYLMQDADGTLAQVTDLSVLAEMLAIGGDVSDYSSTTDSLEAIANAIAAVPTEAMRGTDNAFLAAVGGALDDAAAAGAVTDSDTAMAYIKQLVTAIQLIPTTAMRGTDSASLASVLGALNDAAAAGAVTDADTGMAYLKQIVNFTLNGGSTLNVPQFAGTLAYADAGAADDTASGLTPSTPKKTIAAAQVVAGIGGAVTIKAGTYVEDVVMSYASQELWCEIGTILDGTGTCLTISGGNCLVRGQLDITPAADQIGVAITTQGGNILEDIRVRGAASTCGFDIDTTLNILRRCKVSGIKATAKAYDVGASATILDGCSTNGSAASYGFYVDGTALTGGKLVNCTSAGHTESGYYLDEISKMSVINCSSGAGDGKWKDIDSANIWSDFSYADEQFKEITFNATGSSKNLFKITGTVQIDYVFSHVSTALNADVGNCKLELFDGAATDITTAVDISSAPLDSFIGKAAAVGAAIVYKSSASASLIDWISTLFSGFTVVAKRGTDTYIRLNNAGTATDGVMHWHCRWSPLTDDGFVEPA